MKHISFFNDISNNVKIIFLLYKTYLNFRILFHYKNKYFFKKYDIKEMANKNSCT